MLSFGRRRSAVVGTVVLAVLTVAPADAAAAHTDRPQVESISPQLGGVSGGRLVTVHGSGFAHVAEVTFGLQPGGQVTVQSTRTLTVVAPPHAAGTVHVRVRTVHGQDSRTSSSSARDQFTYVAPPVVRSISPASGLITGGEKVAVSGSRLRGVSRVTFGRVAATALHHVSDQRLTVTAPAHIASTVHVRVHGSFGTSADSSNNAYLYEEPSTAVSHLDAVTIAPYAIRLKLDRTRTLRTSPE